MTTETTITSTKGTHTGTLAECLAWHLDTQGWGAEVGGVRIEDSDLEALRDEALAAGDMAQADACTKALAGDLDALVLCVEAMIAAEAMAD